MAFAPPIRAVKACLLAALKSLFMTSIFSPIFQVFDDLDARDLGSSAKSSACAKGSILRGGNSQVNSEIGRPLRSFSIRASQLALDTGANSEKRFWLDIF